MEVVRCDGRTGDKRSEFLVEITKYDGDLLLIEIDDVANPGFWLKLKLRPKSKESKESKQSKGAPSSTSSPAAI
jgi:hypothetical protein